ncbi:MAG: HNH endonuclease [Deltaproteobacteria bacterium]
MVHRDEFWKLEHLSNAKLLESLAGVLRTQRRMLAELVAHLGEVEDRRLHLEAAFGSMFTYCVVRLGMSEDEACRRIELARLARRFPALFAEIASGQMTLSVALVLKPVLSPSNHLELLGAARGKCVRQVRELVAERFPKPDAPSSIRKLPERRLMQAPEREEAGSPVPSAASTPLPSLAATPLSSTSSLAAARSTSLTGTPLASPSSAADLSAASADMPALPLFSRAAPPVAMAVPAVAAPSPVLPRSSSAVESCSAVTRAGAAPTIARSVIEPLSAQRYRIQFTADAALKQQLEQARDLLRHTHPSGDFGPIVSRALKLLIDDLLRRRFGAGARRTSPSTAGARPAQTPSPASVSGAGSNRSSSERKATSAPTSERASPACTSTAVTSAAVTSAAVTSTAVTSAACTSTAVTSAAVTSAACTSTAVTSAARPSRSRNIPRASRRAVLERDGLGCSWVDAQGVRCGSQAWLQIDHRHPAGKGGSTEPENLRLLCRAHNRWAAEQAYGREHIERASTRRRKPKRAPHPPT